MKTMAKVLYRNEKIVGFIRERSAKGESVTRTQLEHYTGLSSNYVTKIMAGLIKDNKELQMISKKGSEAEYRWIDDLPVHPKNHEGYSDPTAAAAIRNTTNPRLGIGPGEVWGTQESNGATEMIFTLNALNGACQCIKLYHDTEENRSIVGPNPFCINVLGRDYIGDPTHVTFKPLKYCIRRRMFCHTNKLNEAREALAKIFGIPQTVKRETEEKVVYKERPVVKEEAPKTPVVKEEKPKIPDNYVDLKSAYMASLEVERDIWKQVAMKLLDRNS